MNNDYAAGLLRFIDTSPSVYHVIETSKNILRTAGFQELPASSSYILNAGGRYFTTHSGGSALIAWQMNKRNSARGFKIIGSHSDSPSIRIKPYPEIIVEKHFVKLNTEVYGGPILSTWFDRPLTLAGRVIIKTDESLHPEVRLVHCDENLLIIPNLAIHMNRDVNEGYKIDKQKDLLPLLGLVNNTFEEKKYLLSLLAEHTKTAIDHILDFDLYLCDNQPGCFCGTSNAFFSVGKIDNLGMAYASLTALVNEAEADDYIKMVCIFDNEEVGSSTPQGAGSPFLADTIKRISYTQTGVEPQYLFDRFQRQLTKSFFISADQAHGLHPNYPEKNDITNTPLINEGPVIKRAASMSYTSDGISAGVFKSLCSKAGVPCQTFVNRSDMRGGSTIGPITAAHLNMRMVDIGNPILSMHSIRELGGTADQMYITKVFQQFYRP